MPLTTKRYARAFKYARKLHADQARKGTGIPYIAHLMSVSALVLEDGGDEDQAIAGLLHDAVEDQGGDATLDEIRRRFGARVASIVAHCTDTSETPKPPWRERKEKYLAHLAGVPTEVLRVSMSDKLHNARAILFDYRREGEALWSRFAGGRESLWYYRALVETYRTLDDARRSPLFAELERVVGDIERLAGAGDGKEPGKETSNKAGA